MKDSISLYEILSHRKEMIGNEFIPKIPEEFKNISGNPESMILFSEWLERLFDNHRLKVESDFTRKLSSIYDDEEYTWDTK